MHLTMSSTNGGHLGLSVLSYIYFQQTSEGTLDIQHRWQ